MDRKTYDRIHASVKNIDDIEKLSLEYGYPKGVIGTILNQKIVNHVKRNFHNMKEHSPNNLRLWKKGKSIVEISGTYRFPPTLVISNLLQQMGYQKKYTFNHLNELPDRRLAREIREGLESDPFYSPWAHHMYAQRGQMGEEIIAEWLDGINVSYLTEDEMRNRNFSKTPDFLLEKPLEINQQKVHWVESKAVFGNHTEHEHYITRQFDEYRDLYGSGLIIYWYGYLDDISPKNHLIKDYRLEEEIGNSTSRKITELLNFVPGLS
jgi:hypothetical protein